MVTDSSRLLRPEEELQKTPITISNAVYQIHPHVIKSKGLLIGDLFTEFGCSRLRKAKNNWKRWMRWVAMVIAKELVWMCNEQGT